MKRILALAPLTTAATPAFAHLNPEQHGSFAAGLSHPLFGLDHLLVMVAVGLWAAVLGGRACWALPASFMAAMIAGFIAALSGFTLPLVEPMLLASVFALGLVVALSMRLPTSAAMGVVAAFALFHGVAHGSELGAATALTFSAGFVLSTALLHAAGVVVALASARSLLNSQIIRGLGWATVFGGVWAAVAG